MILILAGVICMGGINRVQQFSCPYEEIGVATFQHVNISRREVPGSMYKYPINVYMNEVLNYGMEY